MSRGKQATGKFASSSSSSGYQNDNGDNDDNDDNDSMSANAIESAHFGQSIKATKSKSKSSGKGKLIKGKKDDEAAAEEDEEQEQEQEQEQEEEQHEDEDQEEDEEGQQQEKMSVLTEGAVDVAEENEENEENVPSFSTLKAKMLKLSRGAAAEGGLPNPKKQKLETTAGTAEKADSDGRSGTTTTKGKDKYSGRNRNTQKDAAAAALTELSNVMKNPVVVAHEIVDKDAKKYKFSSRECYDIKKLLGDKSKAVVFIGLTAEERGFWYEDEGYGAKK